MHARCNDPKISFDTTFLNFLSLPRCFIRCNNSKNTPNTRGAIRVNQRASIRRLCGTSETRSRPRNNSSSSRRSLLTWKSARICECNIAQRFATRCSVLGFTVPATRNKIVFDPERFVIYVISQSVIDCPLTRLIVPDVEFRDLLLFSLSRYFISISGASVL